ncbi:hypothetical protein Leryth_001112 [Lithospermum erythrorhizon]|nr:hypothetical protein Leryth_001112 [Lithospermum erythrorhizon]
MAYVSPPSPILLPKLPLLGYGLMLGTERRTARELEEEIENMGGHLNAYTSREQTTYYAKVLDRDVPKALDILSDILQNSTFDDKRIERERDVILREMEEVEGQTEEVIFDHLHATAFQYTPLGRTILGSAENVRSITKKDIKNYIATHYTAPRTVIAASGAVKHEDFVEQVKKLFTKLSTDATTTTELVAKAPASFTGSEMMIIFCPPRAIAFEGASWTDPDSIALMVMQSSKQDTGLFGVYAIAPPEYLDDLAYVIMNSLSKMCYRVSDEDVIRARNQLKSSLLLHIDGTSPVAEDIGRQLLTYGRRIPYAELFARIDAVDASTVKRVANRFIFDKDIALAAVGPIQKLPDYNWFRRRTFMLRY